MPGAFLQAEMSDNELVLSKLKGKFVDMMCEINSEFTKYMWYETTKYGKRIKVLYMKIVQAIYGCIETAL